METAGSHLGTYASTGCDPTPLGSRLAAQNGTRGGEEFQKSHLFRLAK